ncbi:hypothetical protein LCGC14_2852710, partial [marine sediment metagenome]
MKIRQGFISNSSSSSFIVAFPKIPKNQNELQTMLFGDKESYGTPWQNWPAQQVASTV